MATAILFSSVRFIRLSQVFRISYSKVWLFYPQSLDARQGLAFQPFQECAAGCGNIAELVENARVLERGQRIAAAGEGTQKALAGEFRDLTGERYGSGVEGRNLESAHRAVPDNRAGSGKPRRIERDRLQADVQDHLVGADGVDHDRARGRIRLKLLCDGRIDGQDDVTILGLRLSENFFRGIDQIGLAQRLADILALRGEKGVRHRAADHEQIDLGKEARKKRELRGNLGA